MKIADKLSHLTFLFHYPLKISDVYLSNVNSIRQYHLLRILNEVGSLDVKTIAKRLGQAQNTSSELVWRMVEKGLLNSNKDKKDRRKNIISLTEKGELELKKMEQQIDIAFDKFCKRFLNDDEIKEFYKCSEKLFNLSKKIIKQLEEK